MLCTSIYCVCDILVSKVTLFQGAPNERRVLATSDTTQVHPYSNSLDVCPPPRKREKTNGTERSEESGLSGGDSQAAFESKCGDVMSMRPTTSTLVSYKVS